MGYPSIFFKLHTAEYLYECGPAFKKTVFCTDQLCLLLLSALLCQRSKRFGSV